MFKINRHKFFPTDSHPQGRGLAPWYEQVGHKVYRSYGHPNGPSNTADFIVQEGKLIPLQQRDLERPGAPWYVTKDKQFYPGYGHPGGNSRVPWFEERD